jgi:hypothetical protein
MEFCKIVWLWCSDQSATEFLPPHSRTHGGEFTKAANGELGPALQLPALSRVSNIAQPLDGVAVEIFWCGTA